MAISMIKKVTIKPIFFSRRINSFAVIVVLITVLVLKFTNIDKGLYVSIASVIVFLILMILFYLNSKEIQMIEIEEKAFNITFFNKKSLFFRKKDVQLLRNESIVHIDNDKLQIKNAEGFIGNVRLKAIENIDDISVINDYFNLPKET
jgi:MFS superfamily sulfate permease-like transporter